MKPIILRSGSPRRKELLEREHYTFEIIVSDIDETMDKTKTPFENVKTLGLKKASYEQEKYYGSILIG
ncbi:MAG: Maf family protein, partial [Anaeroplasmataceae bacterium]|nr:Maf family protein [Anaeroplasmataceae bacterium]